MVPVVPVVLVMSVLCMGLVVARGVRPLLMDAVAVLVVAGLMGLGGDHPIAFEQADAEQQRQRHLPLHRAQDAGVGFDLPQLALQRLQLRLLHQVAFVEQQHVAVDHLGAGHLPLQQFIAEVLCVDQGDDRIEAGEIPQVAAEEGHRHRQGIRQARGLHHQVIHLLRTVEDAIHRIEQLAVDRAADAAVAQFHHVLARGDDQLVVDADLSELVDQHRRLHSLLIAEDVIEQRCFACAQKAREDRHRQAARDAVHHRNGWIGAGGGHRRRGQDAAVRA